MKEEKIWPKNRNLHANVKPLSWTHCLWSEDNYVALCMHNSLLAIGKHWKRVEKSVLHLLLGTKTSNWQEFEMQLDIFKTLRLTPDWHSDMFTCLCPSHRNTSGEPGLCSSVRCYDPEPYPRFSSIFRHFSTILFCTLGHLFRTRSLTRRSDRHQITWQVTWWITWLFRSQLSHAIIPQSAVFRSITNYPFMDCQLMIRYS